MIDKALMLKWIDALRSGKYAQTRGFMRTPEGFDAMGVLLDVINPKGWGEASKAHEGAMVYIPYTHKGCVYTFQLPYDISDQLGFYESDTFKMIALNDKQCLDFEQIADYLERNYLVN